MLSGIGVFSLGVLWLWHEFKGEKNALDEALSPLGFLIGIGILGAGGNMIGAAWTELWY